MAEAVVAWARFLLSCCIHGPCSPHMGAESRYRRVWQSIDSALSPIEFALSEAAQQVLMRDAAPSMSRGFTIPFRRTYCTVLSNGFVAVMVSIHCCLFACDDESQHSLRWPPCITLTSRVSRKRLQELLQFTDLGRGRWCLSCRTELARCHPLSAPGLGPNAQEQFLA